MLLCCLHQILTIWMLLQKLRCNRAMFSRSSFVRFWWACVNCNHTFLFLGDKSGTRYVLVLLHLICIFWLQRVVIWLLSLVNLKRPDNSVVHKWLDFLFIFLKFVFLWDIYGFSRIHVCVWSRLFYINQLLAWFGKSWLTCQADAAQQNYGIAR